MASQMVLVMRMVKIPPDDMAMLPQHFKILDAFLREVIGAEDREARSSTSVGPTHDNV